MTDSKQKLSFQDMQDEMAREFAESINRKYPQPTTRTFSATVLDPNSPGGVRLIRQENPLVFVDERKPEIVIRRID